MLFEQFIPSFYKCFDSRVFLKKEKRIAFFFRPPLHFLIFPSIVWKKNFRPNVNRVSWTSELSRGWKLADNIVPKSKDSSARAQDLWHDFRPESDLWL